MTILNNFVKQGNYLFRYRSYFPLILFILAVPFVSMSLKNLNITAFVNVIDALSVLICFFGFAIRCYAVGTTPKGTSGRNTKQQVAEQLNTTGIYSVVRHPLYLGNYLISLGIVIFTHSPMFILIFSLLFWIYYERIMAAEEDFIGNKFGDAFMNWAARTPAFLPSFKNSTKGLVPFSIKTVLRREYSGFLSTVISYTYIDYLRLYLSDENVLQVRVSLYVLAIATIITLLLRTLKHHTSVLFEKDRS